MPTGMVENAWPYVIAAYSISTVVFVGYAFSLIQRYRASQKDET